MPDLSRIHVLVPGQVHPYVEEHLPEKFKISFIAAPDPTLINADMASSVRAIATFAGADKALIDALPKLEMIANFGVGYDKVDAAYATSKKIVVSNTPDVLTEEVADTTVALLLNTLREFPKAQAYLRQGQWQSQGPYRLTPLTLRERRIGVYGLGRIGIAVARRLEGFGVSIAYHSRHKRNDVSYTYKPSLKALAESVDTLINVVPGGKVTEKSVNAEILASLGSQGVLINIGRGSSVDTDALVQALEEGTIAAAGLDVFPHEPEVPENLLAAPNTVLLPHVGSASAYTRELMAKLVIDNLGDYFNNGKPRTPVKESLDLL